MIDIGVNLTANVFKKDIDDVIARAFAEGIRAMVIIGSSLSDSSDAIKLSHKHSRCIATAGIHPHHANDWNKQSKSALQKLTAQESVKAIGETGLDFNRNYSSKKAQILAFEQQLELAVECQLPVYLHQRDAHEIFLPMIAAYRSQLPGAVAHCFTGRQKELEDYLNLDMHIGITGWICDERRGYHLHDLIKQIPLNRLMLETDAPYLLPRGTEIPKKTKRNEPAFLRYVLSRVAQCLEMTEEDVSQATTNTAVEFFKLSLPLAS